MELKLVDGDYVPNADLNCGFVTVEDRDELFQRILYKLTAYRGSFPFLPELGSRLWMLHREKKSARVAAARQYIAEALADEDFVRISDVAVTESENNLLVDVNIIYDGTVSALSVEI